jgi:hypothetical protein
MSTHGISVTGSDGRFSCRNSGQDFAEGWFVAQEMSEVYEIGLRPNGRKCEWQAIPALKLP